MNSLGQVALVPNEVGMCQHCDSLLQDATAELSAFIAAVELRYGHQVAERAGVHWVELLEQSSALKSDTPSEFRTITILAATYLADLMTEPSSTPDGHSQNRQRR